jgi:hypothetical protein
MNLKMVDACFLLILPLDEHLKAQERRDGIGVGSRFNC